ncbi:glycoside hydrolase family 3 protein [Enterobacter hormaechei]|uniref:glycoside hydrolase family 3 protein n=1 Tax=Enterobacter hormaechei TaxID=158836 RepID=UPI002949D267|nr:glycoside hydrolase family 3 protein [Enterobacter hormaechei]MDV5373170.1 glycoside hydrolase family 3 protein [Enterobacter hormaechei]
MKKMMLATLLLYSVAHAEPLTVEQLAPMWESPKAAAAQLVTTMSTEEKIGQILMMDFRHWGVGDDGQKQALTKINSDVAKLITDYHLGSVILFRENLIDTPQTVSLINAVQNARSNLPLFVSTDQEGGYVTRLRVGTEMPGNMALGATGSTMLTELTGKIHGEELAALGFNFNFGPVVDVNNNQNNPVIGVRSYSDDPQMVGDLAKSYIRGIHQYGILTSLKHFPGHGNVSSDTHFALPTINIDKATWQNIEQRPFVDAMPLSEAIMTAHVVVPALDGATLKTKSGEQAGTPATLSKPILTGILREQLGYRGLIITDAMDMGAISNNFDSQWAIKQAIIAGNDIVLMPLAISDTETLAKLGDLYRWLKEEYKKDPELKQRIDESAQRVIETKLAKKIVPTPKNAHQAEKIVGSAAHKETEDFVTSQAITVIKNEHVLPWPLQKSNRIFIYSDEKPRNELIAKNLQQIAGEYHVNMVLGDRVVKMGDDNINKQQIASDITGNDLVILATYNLKNNPVNAQKVIDEASRLNIHVIVISTRNPYDIAYLNGVNANIAIYGITGFDVTNNVRNSLETNIKNGLRTLFTGSEPHSRPLNIPKGKLPVDIRSPDGSVILYPRGYGLSWM